MENKKPWKGIIGWQSGDRIWVDTAEDAEEYYNETLEKLNAGIWINGELQRAYSADPASFKYVKVEELVYTDPEEDYTDELLFMFMNFITVHPDVKALKHE